MPLSPGCFEMCAKSDLRAEESVRGVEGIGSADGVGALFELVSGVPRESVTENLRSGLLRTAVARGGDCAGWRAWAVEDSGGVNGSGSCKSSSRNGLQKYRA